MPVNSFENYPMTWKPEKAKLRQPLYLSLAKLLEQDIKCGSLSPHTKLPPQRELADYLDINLSTVTKAFKLCQLNGFLYAVIGRGTFVSPHAGTSISIQDTRANINAIEMGIIKPLDLMNQYTEDALKKVLAKGAANSLLDYSAPFGTPYQKNSALKWFSKFGLHPHAEDIFFTTGGQNAFAVVLITLFHHGDKIATDRFTYSNFIKLSNMLNIKLVPIQGDEKGMLPEDLEMQCRLQGIQGVYLVPTYSNPTGAFMDTPRKEAFQRNLIFEQYFPSNSPTPFSFSRWLPLPPALYDFPMEQLALEKGLHLFHSTRFLVGSPSTEQFLRIAITSTDTKEELEYGLKQLKSLLLEGERKINDFTMII